MGVWVVNLFGAGLCRPALYVLCKGFVSGGLQKSRLRLLIGFERTIRLELVTG